MKLLSLERNDRWNATNHPVDFELLHELFIKFLMFYFLVVFVSEFRLRLLIWNQYGAS